MQTMSLRWTSTVKTVHRKWSDAVPYSFPPTSHEFEKRLFKHHNSATTELYQLLKCSITLETELLELLDKLGKWFISRERWSGRSYRKMVVRSANRYFNDPHANKQLQLLAIVVTHEFNFSKKHIEHGDWRQVSEDGDTLQ